MPVLTQLNLNIGTEQNPNMVLHDLHDIRISSTDVTTVTRLLGCDAGVNSIAPLTLANAASLLGAIQSKGNIGNTDVDTISVNSIWTNDNQISLPTRYGNLIHLCDTYGNYTALQIYLPSDGGIKTRRKSSNTGTWSAWT